ncbi:MAG: NADH-quinone oxidoreductase subunit C [Alphaproteobacteria bacterium]|jgi:NADH-quinone oxidoreductase subunit C|nr:NADH-quinone oxidoreductase subunit C [Alphaproteobacteria bacterium]
MVWHPDVGALGDLAEAITTAFPDDVVRAEVVRDELNVDVQAASIRRILSWLRDEPSALFQELMDLCGVDYPDRPQARFDVVYHLLSVKHNQRVRVRLATDEDTPVPSVTGVFPTAGWFEREAWDMYGVLFAEHDDLRRLLTDYGFEGHPLRKDFPLTGYVEVRYDEEQKRVVYEPVQLQQDWRTFDFLSPWEGAQGVLPGDEKADDAAASKSG